jgi:hypothetical protein
VRDVAVLGAHFLQVLDLRRRRRERRGGEKEEGEGGRKTAGLAESDSMDFLSTRNSRSK